MSAILKKEIIKNIINFLYFKDQNFLIFWNMTFYNNYLIFSTIFPFKKIDLNKTYKYQSNIKVSSFSYWLYLKILEIKEKKLKKI